MANPVTLWSHGEGDVYSEPLGTVDNPLIVSDAGGGGGGSDASAANQVAGNASLTSIDGKTPALGQALAAASTPIVLTALQVAALTPPAAIAGFATATNQGGVTETAPSNDTNSSGLNGRLQRIAQRLTTLIAGIPLLAGEAHVGQVGGSIVRVSGTFTRPGDTTPYTAGDAVSDNATTTTLIVMTGMARVNGGSGYIVGARLSTNLKSIVPRFRLRVFNDAAPTRSADNLAFKSLYTDESKRVARFDLPAMITPIDTTNSDMSSAEDDTVRIPFVCAAGSTVLYVALETLDAFTPANGESFTLTFKADQN